MRKSLAILMVALMVMGCLVGMVSADTPPIPQFPVVYTLYAGQTNDIGEVRVWNDEDNLFVEFWTKSGYGMTETHLHVATSLEAIPTNKSGNPVPGHFEFSRVHKPSVRKTTYTIPLDSIEVGDNFYIAAHAAVGSVMTSTIVSDTQTEFYSGDGWNDAVITWPHPSWPLIDGADWIWNSETAQYPREGEEVLFKRAFDVNGIPLEGKLYITADNEYEAVLNEDDLGFNNNWADIAEYDVTDSLLSGLNTLKVAVDNWAYNTDDPTVNPGGLLYKLEYSYVSANASAWGATGVGENRFVQKGNWATWFSYEVPERATLIESVSVPSTNAQGITTQSLLEEGQEYRLKASGTFTYNNQGDWADAEWYLKAGDIVKGDVEGSVPYVLDVSIDGYVSNIDWGDYTPTHEYNYNFTGTGSTVRFFIHDSNYTDNNGTITVDIYKVIW